MNFPTYHLSKHLSELLSPSVWRSPAAVCNSAEFAEFANIQRVVDDQVLVSFDVVSLFTNVPTALASSVARKRLQADNSLNERTSLDTDTIVFLLRVMSEGHISIFQRCVLPAVFRHGNGFTISVIVANLVMEEIEEKALSTFSPTPQFWKRYVDDMCTVLQSDLVHHFLDHLNSINPHIQFTLKIEKNGCLPFLDIFLSHEPDGSIQTSIFHKPMLDICIFRHTILLAIRCLL